MLWRWRDAAGAVERYRYLVGVQQSPAAAIACAVGGVFVPSAEDAATLRVPASMKFLLYALRPVLLARRYAFWRRSTNGSRTGEAAS